MNAELTRVVSEAIGAQRVIKLFDGYERENTRFMYVNARLRCFAMRAASADAALSPITQLFVSFAVAGVIFVALYQANTGTLTIGSFAAFMAALGQIFDPIKRLTNITSTMQRMLVAAESVFKLVDQDPEPDTGTREFTQPVRGHIEFEAVRHRFPNSHRDTLSDVSFAVQPGQTIALVGRSGSGKTTLANMLPRFLIPTSGQVRVDGIPLDELSLRSLRSQISLVSQDVVLFEVSLATTSLTARVPMFPRNVYGKHWKRLICVNLSKACPKAWTPWWGRTPTPCLVGSVSVWPLPAP